MSIAVFVDEPINEDEKSFYLPVASENFFNSCWKPGCKTLNLQLVSRFDRGINITQINITEIISELNQLQAWAEQNLSGENKKHITERIKTLIDRLPSIFERENMSVFIG